MAFKHKYSPLVVKALRERYHGGETYDELSASIEEETGQKISRHTLWRIVTDDEHISQPPKRR